MSGPSEWLTLLVYSTSDRFVKSFPAQARGVELETIRRTDSALRGGFRFWVYTYWAREAVGLIAGPYAAE